MQTEVEQLRKENAELQYALSTAMSALEFEVDNDNRLWFPTKWWRATCPDGTLWCESSDGEEVRESAHPDDVIERMYRTSEDEWRKAAGPSWRRLS